MSPRPPAPRTGQQPLLRRLFSPVTINRLTLPNRLVMSSLHLNLDGVADQYERMADFYALRARDGVGLIVTAGCAPDAAGSTSPEGFALDRDDLIPRHRTITRAVHAAGGRIALQILHFGREAHHGRIVSASAQRLPANLFTPRPLDEAGIAATVDAFAACAARAVEAGYDAVELIYSQGFLVHQFLAPATNRRTDEWGGSLANRMRLAVAISAAVRARVGDGFPLIFRIPCMDLLDGGLTPEDSLTLVEGLLPFGVDLLNVSIGWHESAAPTIAMTVPRAAFASAARYLKARFPELPVAVSNRINDPRLGERLLVEGYADLIAMGRPFLADPALTSKARDNRFDAINTCIACNQNCLDYVFTGRPVGCSVNPDCGLPGEGVYPPLPAPRRVAVAGGGIAGLGAALFLARRGARVTLFETAPRLGGQLRLAARIPGKAEFAQTLRYYETAVLEAGVELRLGQAFDARAAADDWDHVILAQGSAPRTLPDCPGIGLPHVLGYQDVLEHGCPVAFPVVVVGGGGVACDLAKYLAAWTGELCAAGHGYLAPLAGRYGLGAYLDGDRPPAAAITLLQRSSRKIAHRVGRTTRWILMQTLDRLGVDARTGVDLLAVAPDEVVVRDRARGTEERLPARTLVIAAGHEPRPAPLEALAARGIGWSLVGAARDTGSGRGTNLSSALLDAYTAALALT